MLDSAREYWSVGECKRVYESAGNRSAGECLRLQGNVLECI